MSSRKLKLTIYPTKIPTTMKKSHATCEFFYQVPNLKGNHQVCSVHLLPAPDFCPNLRPPSRRSLFREVHLPAAVAVMHTPDHIVLTGIWGSNVESNRNSNARFAIKNRSTNIIWYSICVHTRTDKTCVGIYRSTLYFWDTEKMTKKLQSYDN